MTIAQIEVFSLLAATIILFIWNRWRYDVVALMALFSAILLGIVPAKEAFLGFADPVVITVAGALILSKALSESGMVQMLLTHMHWIRKSRTLQIFTFTGLVACFSSVINNVAALALFLPAALTTARETQRSPSELLMPMSFASLLGGLTTLIGTPPNVMISAIRERYTGEPFHMFDFTIVGVGITVIGLLYLTIGWRFLPSHRPCSRQKDAKFKVDDYVSEVMIPKKSSLIGFTIQQLEEQTSGNVTILGLARQGQRRIDNAAEITIEENDILLIETTPIMLQNFLNKYKLTLAGNKNLSTYATDEVVVVEAVLTEHSPLVYNTAKGIALRSRYRVNLLAVRRKGRHIRQRIHTLRLAAGDMIVLQGESGSIYEILDRLHCLPLAERGLPLGRQARPFLALSVLLGTVGLGALEILPIHVAFLGAILAIALLKLLSLEEIYQAIDWPILVLLGAMIPVAGALETTDGSKLLAEGVASMAKDCAPMMVITVIMLGTMLVTPFLNNAATVLLMGPIAMQLSSLFSVPPDAFLLAVAIGASSDFLTPIGHQSNTLVLGPGGYYFSDYWRLGLPLSVLVLVIGTLLLDIFWLSPFQ